jgi:hypothetical protein
MTRRSKYIPPRCKHCRDTGKVWDGKKAIPCECEKGNEQRQQEAEHAVETKEEHYV